MPTMKFSDFLGMVNKMTSLVESCDNEKASIFDLFEAIDAEPGMELEDVTTTSGVAQLVVPMALKLAKRLPPNFVEEAKEALKEAFNDEEFLAWLEKMAPIYRKQYGDQAEKILHAVALTKFNKMAGTKLDQNWKRVAKGHGGKKLWEK